MDTTLYRTPATPRNRNGTLRTGRLGTGYESLQFYSMIGQRIWKDWLHRRRQRKLNRLLLQHEVIKNEGMSIFAEVQDCYSTGIAVHNMQLLQVRLKIKLLDRGCIYPLCYAFVPRSWQSLK